MELEVVRIHPEAKLPEYKTVGAACFDIYGNQEIRAKPGGIVDIPTGLVFRIPKGHVMILQPRSSSPKLGYIMPHSVGIIDSDYCGPDDQLFLRLKNVTRRTITFEKHQRLVQAYVLPLPKVAFKEIKKHHLVRQSRGGFGSTGKK